MSRAAVRALRKAQEAARRIEARAHRRDLALLERMRRVEAYAAQDVLVVACEACGLEQLSVGVYADDPEPFWWGRPCVVCGCETARFVSELPAGPWRVVPSSEG